MRTEKGSLVNRAWSTDKHRAWRPSDNKSRGHQPEITARCRFVFYNGLNSTYSWYFHIFPDISWACRNQMKSVTLQNHLCISNIILITYSTYLYNVVHIYIYLYIFIHISTIFNMSIHFIPFPSISIHFQQQSWPGTPTSCPAARRSQPVTKCRGSSKSSRHSWSPCSHHGSILS